MAKCPAKYRRAFYEAQEEVRKVMAPYLPRCCGQYFEPNSAIETFTVYSKEQDAFEGRHRLRGIVTVWYGFPTNSRKEACYINLSFDSGMMGWHHGDLAVMLDRAIPALPPEEPKVTQEMTEGFGWKGGK